MEKLHRPAHAVKTEIVNTIAEKMSKCQGMAIAEYKNLTVAQISDLRDKAREQGIFVKVYKDSLVKRAAEANKLDGLIPFLTQQNIYVFSDSDPLAPAKLVANFAKTNDALKLKAGLYEGSVLDTAKIQEIAALPTKEELYSMFASSLIYPLRQFMLVVKEIAKTKSE